MESLGPSYQNRRGTARYGGTGVANANSGSRTLWEFGLARRASKYQRADHCNRNPGRPVLHRRGQSFCSALTISKSCEHLLCFGQTLLVSSHGANQKQRVECVPKNRSGESSRRERTACPDALEQARVLSGPRRAPTPPRRFRAVLEEDGRTLSAGSPRSCDE